MNLALTATSPVIGNYFNGVLEGLVGSLGIKIHEDEDPPRSTQKFLEKRLAGELEQLSVSAPSLEGCESHGLHVGYSLQYADREKGPSVPALSSTALPDLLDAIDCLRLGMSTQSDEDQSSEEQQDLLELLAVKEVPRSSKTKEICEHPRHSAPHPESSACSKAKGEPTCASEAGISSLDTSYGEPNFLPRGLVGLHLGSGKDSHR